MTNSDWLKLNFQQFVNEFGIEIVIRSAPRILYPKKDKEHEATNSLIALLFVAAALCAYLAATLALASIWFSLPLFVIVLIIGVIICVVLILNYMKSSVFITPMECWVEIFKSRIEPEIYCLVFYIIFTGKCHPNKAKNVIYKLYQNEILKSKIDITQIELYAKFSKTNELKAEYLGYNFQYGEGKSFKDEKINRNVWKYFSVDKTQNENYIAVANWDHQYEWRNDLNLDFDKLHAYAPWVIKGWNSLNIKPLNEEYKEGLNWHLRYIEDFPKLKPWIKGFEGQSFESKNSHKDLEILEDAINKIQGPEYSVEKLNDLKDDLFKFKAYFRDLKL